MSLIPEFIFQTIIARGIRTLRNDSKFLDQLFRNLPQAQTEQIREFLRTNTIHLTLNWPRSDLKMPSIVILLKNDNEASDGTYLADSMGIGRPDEFGFDGELPETLGGAATTSSLSGQGKIVFGPHLVLSATLNTIKVSDTTWKNDELVVEGVTVHIIGGTGVGQQRTAVSNSRNTIMVSPNWTTIPDTTSVFEVRAAEVEVLGEPTALYDRRDPASFVERLGSLYDTMYEFQVIDQKPESTIILNTIVRSIMTLSRTFLEQQGVINMQLSATDFVPRAEYIPDHAYVRALRVNFKHPFDIFEPRTDLVTQFRVVLEALRAHRGE
jgi:hypothetical protein